MDAIILTRVSTKEQEDGHSLAAQADRLQDYCQKKGIDIIKEFTIIESSTRGDRPKFNAMIQYIKKQPNKVALVCDKVDRLQRSFKELPILEELRTKGKLELHFNSENQVLDENANSSQMMAYHMFILMANNFTNCISDNVKRSNELKRKEGTICGSAPLGYKNFTNECGKKDVMIDLVTSPYIKRMFTDYIDGHSFNEVKKRVNQAGLRSKKGHKIGKSAVECILINPFYHGFMKIKGKLYPHQYPKLIDEHIFNKCEKIRLGKKAGYSKHTKTDFIFKGFIKCKECNGMLSPEKKKNKYIYLRPNSKGNCECKQINEKVALESITGALDKLSIPKHELDAIQNTIRTNLESEVKYSKAVINSLRKRDEGIDKKRDKLLDLLISESITQDIYDKKLLELNTEQHGIKLELDKHTTTNENYAITLEYLIGLVSRAKDLFESSGIDQKRKIIKLLFSNLYLEGESVTFTMTKPFNLMLSGSHNEKWLRQQGSNL